MGASSPIDPFQDPTAGLVLRRPGQGAREEARRLFAQQRFVMTLARAFRIQTDERAWRVGAAGEERVGALLNRLPKPDWLVLHDLPAGPGNANLDHLVVGPPGVLAIDTKHHPRGKVSVGREVVFVNGRRTGYRASIVRQARHVKAGILAYSSIEFGITPVLAIVAKELNVPARLPDIVVVEGRYIHRWIRRQEATFTGSELWQLRHDVAAWAKSLEGRQLAPRGLPAL